MNIEKLLEVKKAILANPERFDMEDFFSDYLEKDEVANPIHKCGTTACIAGWALAIEYKNCPEIAFENKCFDTRASKILDITTVQSDRLFYHYFWYKEFLLDNDLFCMGDDFVENPTAQQAADYIDYFIKKNSKDD